MLALISSNQNLAQINNDLSAWVSNIDNSGKCQQVIKYTLARKSPLEHSAFRSSTSWTYICMQKNNILEEIWSSLI